MWFYVILAILLFLLISFSNSNTYKGWVGERQVEKVLKDCALKYGGIEFRDFMFEDDKSSSQVDNMLLTQKALYVIEVKNYNGHIFGSEENLNWTVTVKHVYKKRSKSGKTYKKTSISKHKFYNPLKQNKTHINKIKNLTNISNEIPVFNIVLFGKKAYLRDVTHSSSVYVVHYSELKELINKLEEGIDTQIDLDVQTDFVDVIYDINIVDKKRRKGHVKNLKEKYRK
jgi:hypothetical protein